MSDELKPCPFCGGGARFLQRAVGIRGTGGYDWWHAIQCAKCNASIGYDDNRYRDKNDAIKAWNTRTPPQASAELVEKELLQDALDELKSLDGRNTGEGFNEVDVELLKRLKAALEAIHG